MNIRIAPSILSADFSRLGEVIRAAANQAMTIAESQP